MKMERLIYEILLRETTRYYIDGYETGEAARLNSTQAAYQDDSFALTRSGLRLYATQLVEYVGDYDVTEPAYAADWAAISEELDELMEHMFNQGFNAATGADL